jgi:hypothetical protein
LERKIVLSEQEPKLVSLTWEACVRRIAGILDVVGSAINLYFFVDYSVYLVRFLAEGVRIEGLGSLFRFITGDTGGFLRFIGFFPLLALVAVFGALLAGIFSLRRRRWIWAVAGSILILPIPVINAAEMTLSWPMNFTGLVVGITATILTIKARPDFVAPTRR